MAVILPTHYPLLNRRISLLSEEQAQRADIRPLRVGIINVMPQAERYEYHLLYPLAKTIIQVEPVWIRLADHTYRSSDKNHLDRYYRRFEEANADRALDGLILTGAPIEQLPYDQVTYWEELSKILQYARAHIPSTLGICWGGLALAKLLGIEKVSYPMKIFGVYEARNLDRSHPITGDFDDVFACPQSRHSGIDDPVLEQAQRDGSVHLLAHADGAGYVIFESSDRRFLMHLGHPEYEAERIATEYWRDQQRGRTDVAAPTNYDLKNPMNRWRTNCLDFFTQWLRFLFDTTESAPTR